MKKQQASKATLVIAGPGAGKTHNMVDEIIANLPILSSCRFMVVITHTNAATNNIKERLAKRITVPVNLFIGTIHSFLNKFIVVPYSSFKDAEIPQEKLFVQFGIDAAVNLIQRKQNISGADYKEKAKLRSRVVSSLKKKGYITFDQTLALSKDTMSDEHISKQVANRIQFLFVDEFQDTGNEVFSIIEKLRKIGSTKIYCVGDPEQYIQSFDSTIRTFNNIPILKAAGNSGYSVVLNLDNYRCTGKIVAFLNKFNSRTFNNQKFEQVARSKNANSALGPSTFEPELYFINGDGSSVSQTIDKFYTICEKNYIGLGDRCILAKQELLIKRIAAAVNNQFKNPKKSGNLSPINVIRDTVLYMLSINSEEYCTTYNKSSHDLRKLSIELLFAIKEGQIKNENDFGNYLSDNHDLIVNRSMLVKIEDLKFSLPSCHNFSVVTVANIHTIKGLEHKAVLSIAKDEAELLRWLEIDRLKRDLDKDDVCRIGYVAFSRAERLLSISCLKKVSKETEKLLSSYGFLVV